MTKIPKYIPDTPQSDDFFQIHSQMAEMLSNTITAEDVSKNSFTLGLLGSWGSGKSLTIGKLRQKVSGNHDILFIEFDVWKYVDTSLYRSILIDLEKDLKIKAEDNRVDDVFNEGIKTSEGNNLHEVLYKSTQVATPKLDVAEDWISKLSHKWNNKSKIGKIKSFLLLTPLSVAYTMLKYIFTRGKLFYFLIFTGVLFSYAFYYRSNIEGWMPFLSDAYLKPVFRYLAFSVLGLSAIELIKESFKDLFKEMLPKTNNNVIITSPPTFAQDQFEDIFKQVIENISKQGTKKIVIVFDNIDRCESNVTIQILTGLKTFLDQKNCFYLIPCDDLRIKKHLRKTTGAEDDYLDKIFQAYIRIPLIEGDDKITFIEKCIELADFELEKKDELKISQILTLAYKAETPRQIKRFFNDFISYYRLAEVIDPNKQILLKDIAYFTFMIALKQKWSEIENLILENPNFFKELDTYNNKPEIVPKDCYQFIETCASWIDQSIDPANFIYLKNSKNSSNQVQRIFINSFNEFKITTPLIQQIEKYLNSLANSNKFILFELGIDRLKEIIETKKNEIDEHLLPEIFKVYFRTIIIHYLFTEEKKKPTFLLTHSKFISEHIIQVNNLDINQIPNVEKHICELIRKTEPSEAITGLYNSLKEQFSISNLKLIFNLISYDEFIKLQQIALNTDKDRLLKIFELTNIESIANNLTFIKDENAFVQLLNYLDDRAEIKPTKKIVSTKVTQAFSQVQSHPAPHNYDAFILKGLSTLKGDDWNAPDKSNFNAYLNTRLQQLFPQNQNDLAINYCIEGIRNQIPIIQNYFAANGQQNLNSNNIFTPFIERINDSVLTIGLENPVIRENILRISTAYSLQSKVLEKLNFNFIKNNIDSLIYNNLNWLTELLKQYDFRKQQSVEISTLNTFEKNVLEKYVNTFPNLIYPQYQTILSFIKSEENKNFFIEKAVEYFRTNHITNALHISNLITTLGNTDYDTISRIYSSSKMQLIEIDNQDLFKGLVTKLNGRDRDDYLERVFIKVNTDLKAPGKPKAILQNISIVLSKEELQNKQRIVVDLIKELFEPSREEPDIRIGMDLLIKLKDGNRSRSFGIENEIKKIIETAGKFDTLKNELSDLL